MKTEDKGGALTRDGERDFLVSLVRFARLSKLSPRADIARAARKWERAIIFRIKIMLQARSAHDKRVQERKGAS